jgi:S-methylmethionine-dependent homocysteine/selenocysteine methylase
MTLSFVEAARESCARVGAYANAGAPEEGLGWAADVDAAADRYLQLADRWVAAGASLLGGCCGTGPAHVRRLAERRATQRTLRTSTRP